MYAAIIMAITTKKVVNSFSGRRVVMDMRDTYGNTKSMIDASVAQAISMRKRPICGLK